VAQLGAGFGSGYPSIIDTRQTYRNTDSAAPDSDTRIDSEFLNDVLAAIVQLETALGANVNGTFASLAARLQALILQAGGVELGGASSGSNVVSFAVPMHIVIPGLEHQQGTGSLLFQVYDTATPPNALQPNSVSVHPTTFDVIMTFATAQVGTALVANPTPSYLTTFTSETTLIIPGTTHGLGQTFLLFQVYDADIPAQALLPQSLSVNPTTKDVTLTFAVPQSGTLRLAAGSARYVQTFGSAVTWAIPAGTHGLGSANLLWQCYDTSANPQAIQPQGVSVSSTGDVLVTFALAQAGTILLVPVPVVAPSLAGQPVFISVGAMGARGDGVTNDSPAIQAAVNRAITEGIRHVYFPPGSYLLNSTITVTDASINISGAGIETTKLLVNNGIGGLAFVSNGQTGVDGSAHHLWLHDLTFVAWGTGSLNRGYAVRATWPAPSAVPATPHATLNNIGIRSRTYDSDHVANPYFTKGLHLINSQDLRVSDVHIMQINNLVGDMIHLDYAFNAGAYRATLRGLEIIGGGQGIYVYGWAENIQISEFEIVGQPLAIHVEGTTAYSAAGPPALFISRGHVNGAITSIFVKLWTDIHISDLSLYVFARPSSTVLTDGIYLESCQDVTITGCRFGCGPNYDVLTMNMIRAIATIKLLCATNNFVISRDGASSVHTGISVGLGCSLVQIQGNTFTVVGSTASTRGILLQTYVVNTDQISVLGNRFENLEVGIVAVDMYNVLLANNIAVGAVLPMSLSGVIGPNVIIRQNHPQTARLLLPSGNVAPFVSGAPDGLAWVNNPAPITITQFQGGHEGMTLELYSGNTNTTLQHNGTMILRGAINASLPAGGILTLRETLGAWREISRNF